MKIVILIVSFFLSSATVGTGVLGFMAHKWKPHTTVQAVLAQHGYDRQPPPADTLDYTSQLIQNSNGTAVNSMQIENQQKAIDHNADSIRVLYGRVNDLSLKEATDTDRLFARIDLDEGKIAVAIWVVGIIMTLVQGFLIFIHFDDRFRKRMKTVVKPGTAAAE